MYLFDLNDENDVPTLPEVYAHYLIIVDDVCFFFGKVIIIDDVYFSFGEVL